MKKRLLKVYVPYLLFTLVCALLFGTEEISAAELVLPIKSFHFIASIVTLYPILYLVALLDKRTGLKLRHMFWICLATVTIYFYFVMDCCSYSITQHYSVFELGCFLCCMLLGGAIREGSYIKSVRVNLAAAAVGFIGYAVFSYVTKPAELTIFYWYISWLFIWGVSGLAVCMEESLPELNFIEKLSELTLSAYLVQFVLIEAFSGMVFPINAVLCFISICAAAFCLNSVSNRLTGVLLPKKAGAYTKNGQ